MKKDESQNNPTPSLLFITVSYKEVLQDMEFDGMWNVEFLN